MVILNLDFVVQSKIRTEENPIPFQPVPSSSFSLYYSTSGKSCSLFSLHCMHGANVAKVFVIIWQFGFCLASQWTLPFLYARMAISTSNSTTYDRSTWSITLFSFYQHRKLVKCCATILYNDMVTFGACKLARKPVHALGKILIDARKILIVGLFWQFSRWTYIISRDLIKLGYVWNFFRLLQHF